MEKIGVVGAGNMGAGIAQKYASSGFTVVVVDMDDASAAKGRDRVKATLDEGVARKIFDAAERDAILGRMTFTGDRDALKGAALVVEAVFEDKKVKQDLFKDLDARLGPDTLLATNTSSFFVDDVAEPCKHKDRVLGLHYFYHPAKNRLVEVIAGKATSKEAFAKAWSIQEQTGKIAIDSKDAPGFIVNRFFVPWLNEAMRLVEEKVADIPTIEAAAKKAFGVGMGPFELMNVTGVPITLHAATTLGTQISKAYAPAELIRPVVADKRNWDLSGTPDASKLDVVGDRLWAVVAQIACTLVFDEKVCTLEDCDLGARVGLRWPKGPFEGMNERGTKRTLDDVTTLVQRWPDLKVPAVLREQGAKNEPFNVRFVTSRKEGDVGFVTMNRPDAMNALDETVVAQLAREFDALDADASVKGIVLEGKGKAFVAGADTKLFVRAIEGRDVPRIVKFAAGGQELLQRIDASKKTVVCALHGLSLGGGSELALACDVVVASSKATLGFPETGLGIYPGLGGTQRTARRIGVPLARWLLLTGETVDAKTALAMGLIDEVHEDAKAFKDAVVRAAKSGKRRELGAPPTKAPKGFEDLWTFFTWTSTQDLLAGRANATDPVIAKSVKKAAFKGPLASLAADELAKRAATDSLEACLRAETEGLARIFSTKDAYEGLSALGVRRPTFKGV
jgi:enoyl-CoA hydratase / 3-hydroxyacyl-CoA dehydrogenase